QQDDTRQRDEHEQKQERKEEPKEEPKREEKPEQKEEKPDEAKPPPPPKLPPDQQMVKLEGLRYSQADASPEMDPGGEAAGEEPAGEKAGGKGGKKKVSIDDVADEMKKNGWDYTKDPADVVEYPDGRRVTVDHRRLVAANKAGLTEVPARVHPASEPIPPGAAQRFQLPEGADFVDPETGQQYKGGDQPKNWGEAAKFRSAKQRVKGHPDFPIEGSENVPTVKAPKAKAPKPPKAGGTPPSTPPPAPDTPPPAPDT